jgi:hypothetical protein
MITSVGTVLLIQIFKYRFTFLVVGLAAIVSQIISVTNLGGGALSTKIFNISMIIGQSFTAIAPIYRVWGYFSYRWKF